MPGAVHAVIGTDDGRVAEEALALFNDLKPEGDAAEELTERGMAGQADILRGDDRNRVRRIERVLRPTGRGDDRYR